eukprot:3918305-Pleurochrysis_carterae.AAC.1
MKLEKLSEDLARQSARNAASVTVAMLSGWSARTRKGAGQIGIWSRQSREKAKGRCASGGRKGEAALRVRQTQCSPARGRSSWARDVTRLVKGTHEA